MTDTQCGHDWRFDGDDPYIVCAKCHERRDALSGRTVIPAPTPDPVHTARCRCSTCAGEMVCVVCGKPENSGFADHPFVARPT